MDLETREILQFFGLDEKLQSTRRIIVQGDLFQFLYGKPACKTPKKKKGQGVNEFSHAARLRLLRWVARVNWNVNPCSQFCTFTYPDECLPRDREALKRDRFQLHREMETVQGRRVSALWRTEWVRRQEGKHTGIYCPHHHYIFFRLGYFPYKTIRVGWKRIIGANEEPQQKFILLDSSRKAGMYVSKYTAKTHPECKLDNVPNWNKKGKHYGFCRREEIPMMPATVYESLTESQARALIDEVARDHPYLFPHGRNGFSLLGARAIPMKLRIAERKLDKVGVFA